MSHRATHSNYQLAFITSFVILLLLSLLIFASTSFVRACQKFDDCFFYLKRQLLVGFLPGLFLFFFFSKISIQWFKKIATPLLLISIISAYFVFIPGLGIEHGGAKQWLNFGGFNFQPLEVLKLAVIIFFAAWLAKKAESGNAKPSFTAFLFLAGFVLLPIFLQPDLGGALMILSIIFFLYYLNGLPLSKLFFLSLIFILGVALYIIISPIHWSRIKTFVNPSAQVETASYQVNQSVAAISSGGLWGKGLGLSTKKISSLPEVINDSLFAVLAEELGFFLTSAIICLYFFLIYLIFQIAKHDSYDLFTEYLISGIGFLFFIQVAVNVGGMLGLLPLTGVTLPFFSYGGTSFCIFSAAFGIVYNFCLRPNLDRPFKNRKF